MVGARGTVPLFIRCCCCCCCCCLLVPSLGVASPLALEPPLSEAFGSWRSMCILRITDVGVNAAIVGLRPLDGDDPLFTVEPCVVVGERVLWASCCLRRFSFCFWSSRIFLSRAVCRMDCVCTASSCGDGTRGRRPPLWTCRVFEDCTGAPGVGPATGGMGDGCWPNTSGEGTLRGSCGPPGKGDGHGASSPSC